MAAPRVFELELLVFDSTKIIIYFHACTVFKFNCMFIYINTNIHIIILYTHTYVHMHVCTYTIHSC